LEFANGCTLECFGFGSSIRGGHYHLFVIDDPCKDEGSGSMDLQQQIKYFSSVMIPAVRKNGQLIVTGNPVDKHDFLEWFENNPKFLVKKYPAFDDNKIVLWPEQYTYEDLIDRMETIPQDVFEREYLLMRTIAGSTEFFEECIK